MKRKPIVAIVGRPNVGKSTLVNRLVGSRESIVDDMPGVTRDRIYFDVEWTRHNFTIIDTGGIVPGMEDEIMMSIYAQAEIAAEQADAIIFVVDGIEGLNPIDIDIANLLRRIDKKIFLAVNKIDTPEKELYINDFYSLGIGEPHSISAMHGSGGVGDLLDELVAVLPEYVPDEDDAPIKLAIVGKPNAGKSSLVNSLLGEERVIVSEIAGTTRDTIDTEVCYGGNNFVLLDTAGIRKKSKVDYGVEKFAVTRAIKAIDNADIAILLLDIEEGLTDQDKKISQMAIKSGKGLILVMNKWDTIEGKDSLTINKYTKEIRDEAPFLDFAPMLFISAKTKQRIEKLFPLALETYAHANKKISTSILNRILLEAFALNPPTSVKGKKLKAYYATQLGVAPPTFIIFINDLKLVKENYKRYLEKKFREAFGFFGTPIRLVFRERKEKKVK